MVEDSWIVEDSFGGSLVVDSCFVDSKLIESDFALIENSLVDSKEMSRVEANLVEESWVVVDAESDEDLIEIVWFEVEFEFDSTEDFDSFVPKRFGFASVR